MERRLIALALAVALSPLAVAQDGQATTQSPDAAMSATARTESPYAGGWMAVVSNYVLAKDHAYAVGPPILVAGPSVSNPGWSPSGRFLVFDQVRPEQNVLNIQDGVRNLKTPNNESALCAYSLSAGRSVDLMGFDATTHHSDTIYWFPDSDKAIVYLEEVHEPAEGQSVFQTEKFYILDAPNATMKEFSPWTMDGNPRDFAVSPSPTKPYAFVSANFVRRSTDDSGHEKSITVSQVFLMGANERLIPVKVDEENVYTVWSIDGSKAYAFTRIEKNGRAYLKWYQVSLSDGSMTQMKAQPDDFSRGPVQPAESFMTVKDIPQPVQNGRAREGLNSIWLETNDDGDQNHLLLAGDATDGGINKTLDCASYLSQGSLYVRPITEVPKARFEMVKAVWNRTQALRQVRESGLALIMYGADNDDSLPTKKSNLYDLLGPYVRDTSTLNGFVYTFGGGDMNTVKDPSKTQLGYIDCPDGKAVVYADGHASWIPKPK